MLLNQVALGILYNSNGEFWIKTNCGLFQFPGLSLFQIPLSVDTQALDLKEHFGTLICDIRKDDTSVMIKLSDGSIILYSFNFDPASGEVHANVDIQSALEASEWEQEFLEYPPFA